MVLVKFKIPKINMLMTGIFTVWWQKRRRIQERRERNVKKKDEKTKGGQEIGAQKEKEENVGAELNTWRPPITRVVNLHFRPRTCGGSKVLLAHTGCWGGGFCLLCRQASMARWAQYYNRGSSADNLSQEKKKKKQGRMLKQVRYEVKAVHGRVWEPPGAFSPRI